MRSSRDNSRGHRLLRRRNSQTKPPLLRNFHTLTGFDPQLEAIRIRFRIACAIHDVEAIELREAARLGRCFKTTSEIAAAALMPADV